ncbi:hypothetical protein EV421DRAFT_1741695 [Armillaria borealis]|uniref:Uncharacterized protein n=1 Tax=Armillaria borealis TaxID=47425 RepID=A0AA39MFS9_9AGAR|nr:hypothetical protein EV421DRAFT_1741695 [Armillaria borealis]
MSEKKTKAASGLVICNYNGHKVTNTYLTTSNMSSPRDTEDWEVPVSEIREWTYTLIELFGYGSALSFRDKAMESPLNERAVMLLACEGEVLRNYAAVSDRVTAWRNNVTVVPSHAPSIHPFDSHRRVFSFLNSEPYTPGEAPDDAPTLDAGDYERWLLLTVLGKPRHDDRKASEGRNILWRLVHHDPRTEPYDWEDFLRSKRDDRTQHHRASRDERTNAIYDNTASDTLVRLIRDRWACSDSRLPTTMSKIISNHHFFHRRQQRASSVTLVGVVLGMVRITSGEAPWSWWKEEKNNMDAVYNVKEREKIHLCCVFSAGFFLAKEDERRIYAYWSSKTPTLNVEALSRDWDRAPCRIGNDHGGAEGPGKEKLDTCGSASDITTPLLGFVISPVSVALSLPSCETPVIQTHSERSRPLLLSSLSHVPLDSLRRVMNVPCGIFSRLLLAYDDIPMLTIVGYRPPLSGLARRPLGLFLTGCVFLFAY